MLNQFNILREEFFIENYSVNPVSLLLLTPKWVRTHGKTELGKTIGWTLNLLPPHNITIVLGIFC